MSRASAMLAALMLACSTPAARSESVHGSALPLRRVADVPLSGGTTRWDYASLDQARHHLFLAHLGDGVVTVFDTQRNRVIANIPGVSAVHGVLFVPELDRVYASATGTHEVVAIDARSLAIVARTPAGVYPDGMAYAAHVHKLYVSDEQGNADVVIDTRTNRRLATIALGGEVGNTQYDPASQHVWANEQKHSQLVEIDPASDRVVNRINLPGAQGNHGLLIDAATRRAFIACEDNHKLLVLDLATRKITASFEVGDAPDVLAFDPAMRLLYVASESGTVSMFEVGGSTVQPVGSGEVGPNAHVVVVDPATHRSYFPLRNVGGAPMLRIMSLSMPR